MILSSKYDKSSYVSIITVHISEELFETQHASLLFYSPSPGETYQINPPRAETKLTGLSDMFCV